MNIAPYIDSTYLKTPAQSGLSEDETRQQVFQLADEAIQHQLYAVMIRPQYVKAVKAYLAEKQSAVKVGTVIGFHEGTAALAEKLTEAQKAIADGADDLDFVINYEAYKAGNIDLVKEEFLKGSTLALQHGKTVKWIIEIAALSDAQIAELTASLSRWAEETFTIDQQQHIFVKSSTGFYKPQDGRPNGATPEGIKIMKANAGNLAVKAAGGVRTSKEAEAMIALGVTRIGTSSAVNLLSGGAASAGY